MGSKFSVQNLRGTPLAVLLIVAAAMLGLAGFSFAFKGHVQI